MTGGGSPGRIARLLVAAVEMYRHMVSPFRPPACRFTPTCSHYAVQALTSFGALRGGWLTVLRIGKCGPWHDGGWDPIPDRQREARPELRSMNV